MKRSILMFTLLLGLILSVPAGAQSNLAVDVLQVQLWPEYDQPSMLVIYTMELSDTQPLPVDVTVRIPKSVGIPSAVAVLEDSTLVTREYTRAVDGDWAEITLQVDFPQIQIEYYDTALSQQDQPRKFDFRWLADYDVSNLIVSVRQPVNASGITITPSLGSGVQGSDGLLIYSSSMGPVSGGQTFDLLLSYTKSDTTLSSLSGISSAPVSQSQPEATIGGPLPIWAWGLIGLGVVVLVGGGILLYRSNQSYEYAGSYTRKKKQATSRRRPSSAGKTTGTVFCHNCGTQALAGDKFCRECGTKLRL